MNNIALYPFQERAVSKAVDHFKTKKKGLIVIPTGGGKTVVFSEIIKRLNAKTLIICHRIELVEQALKTARRMGIGHLVTVKMVQRTYREKKHDKYDFIIIDECHHALAKSYQISLENISHRKLLGVTATPYRLDRKKLTPLFGHPIVNMGVSELIKLGFLCDAIGYHIKTNTILPQSKNKDFSSRELASVINVANRNELIVESYLSYFIKPPKAVCFAASVQHGRELKQVFQKKNIRAELLTGAHSSETRRSLLDRFREGSIDVMINYNILTEGFDEPSIECLLMCRPTMSRSLYIQMLGRGLRTYPGKDSCTVLEFTDANYDVMTLQDSVATKRKNSFYKTGSYLSELAKKEEDLVGSGTVKKDLKISLLDHVHCDYEYHGIESSPEKFEKTLRTLSGFKEKYGTY